MPRRLTALLIFALFAAVSFAGLSRLTLTDHPLHDYVSDEVWYVSAARNLLYILGLQPRPCPGAQATLFYNDTLSMILLGPVNATTLSNATAVVLPWPVTRDYNASATRCCFRYPDSPRIQEYLNLEHPPLAKYILALAMLVGGDCPFYWRLTAITIFSLGVGLLAAALYLSAPRLVPRGMEPSIPVLLAMLWPVALAKSSVSADAVAILEPFAAGFGLAAVASALLGRRRLAYLLAALSVASKYTGLAYLAAIMLWDRFESGPGRAALRALAHTLGVAMLLYAPLAYALGPERLYEKTVGGLEWFLESRPPGPVASTPLDWLLGRNAFTLYTSPEIVAAPNPALMVAGLAASLYLLTASPLNPRYAAIGAPLPVFMALMTLVYASGNHTLYSFYVAAVEPMSAAALSTAIPLIVKRGLQPIREGAEAWGRLPEVRLAARLAGERGAPLAVVAVYAAAGMTGSGVGLFASQPEGRLTYMAVAGAALLLASTAALWERVKPLPAALAAAGALGLLPATQLLLLLLAVRESPNISVIAPLVYPSIAALPLIDARVPRVALGLAAYAAARMTGLAAPPGLADSAAALAAAAYAGIVGSPPASIYTLLALMGDRGAGMVASAVLASEGLGVPAALAALAAHTWPGNPLPGLLALAASLYVDAVRGWRVVGRLVARRRLEEERAERVEGTRPRRRDTGW